MKERQEGKGLSNQKSLTRTAFSLSCDWDLSTKNACIVEYVANLSKVYL